MSTKAHLRYLDRQIASHKRQLRSELGQVHAELRRQAARPVALSAAFAGGLIVGWRRKKRKPSAEARATESTARPVASLLVRLAEALMPLVSVYVSRFAEAESGHPPDAAENVQTH